MWGSAGWTRSPGTTPTWVSPTGPRTTGPGSRPATRSLSAASTPTTTPSTCSPSMASSGGGRVSGTPRLLAMLGEQVDGVVVGVLDPIYLLPEHGQQRWRARERNTSAELTL